jgi:hypothetical protein
MQHKTGRLAALLVLVVGLLVALAAPASAANQISGVAIPDPTGQQCPPPPAGYEQFTDLPPLVMTGSLEGCLYTHVVSASDNGAPSGVYQERGEEIFVGSLNGGPEGTFGTTYKFTGQWDPDLSGSEVRGRCEHPIIAGSGTGGFEGATGRIDFKDDVVAGEFLYRGHISLR